MLQQWPQPQEGNSSKEVLLLHELERPAPEVAGLASLGRVKSAHNRHVLRLLEVAEPASHGRLSLLLAPLLCRSVCRLTAVVERSTALTHDALAVLFRLPRTTLASRSGWDMTVRI